MVCDAWAGKLDTYLDGELEAGEARALGEHLRACAACAAEALSRVQQKRALQVAGDRFAPDAAFRARVRQSIAAPRPAPWKRLWLPVLAGAMVLLIALAVSVTVGRRNDRQLLSELADMHVATLASTNPVDVISTDRHTVKPWFAGKIPFTFNLPELKDSPFSLVGGKVSYLNQSPGAELLYRVRQHQISVFIFQEQALGNMRLDTSAQSALSFNMRTWSSDGLRYFVVSDVAGEDLDRLSELLRGSR
jgi:anti-sigma factor RsiW